MRKLRQIDKYRNTSKKVTDYFGGVGDDYCGAFNVPSPSTGEILFVLASNNMGWEHVSVSHETRCPTWEEMDYVKRLFFKPTETAMQLHVAEKNHISVHPNCLHLWRPKKGGVPLPPKEFV